VIELEHPIVAAPMAGGASTPRSLTARPFGVNIFDDRRGRHRDRRRRGGGARGRREGGRADAGVHGSHSPRDRQPVPARALRRDVSAGAFVQEPSAGARRALHEAAERWP